VPEHATAQQRLPAASGGRTGRGSRSNAKGQASRGSRGRRAALEQRAAVEGARGIGHRESVEVFG